MSEADVVEKNMNKISERNFNIFGVFLVFSKAKNELKKIGRDENDKRS